MKEKVIYVMHQQTCNLFIYWWNIHEPCILETCQEMSQEIRNSMLHLRVFVYFCIVLYYFKTFHLQ